MKKIKMKGSRRKVQGGKRDLHLNLHFESFPLFLEPHYPGPH